MCVFTSDLGVATAIVLFNCAPTGKIDMSATGAIWRFQSYGKGETTKTIVYS